MSKVLLLVLLSVFTLLQVHNTLTYPILQGFDAESHINYINFFLVQNRVPFPTEGWEMYQPPLYYFLASLFPRFESARLLGFISWIVLLLIAYYFFKKRFQPKELYLMGTLLTVSYPVVIYLTPAIGNEFFSAVLMSIALVYYLSLERLGKKSAILLGLLLSLSILSKTTAFVLVIAILLAELYKSRGDLKNGIKYIAIVVCILYALAGWFFIRNAYLYKKPFISNYDIDSSMGGHLKTPRDLRFFTDLSAFQRMDLTRANLYSFWGGTYFSWFYDGHKIFLGSRPNLTHGIILVILTIPLSLIAALGFVKAARKISRENFLLIIYPTLLFAAYVLYNLKIPYETTVKGTFLTSLAIPLTYFFLKGIEPYGQYFKYIVLYLICYSIVILRIFWIVPNWYQP